MRTSRISARLLAAALATLALAGAAVASTPPEAAQAQGGYRVCGTWDSTSDTGPGTQGTHIGSGLVTKVWVKGGQTCASKVGFMTTFYDVAYPSSLALNSFRMSRCEDFSTAIGGHGWDVCFNMDVNKIYKYSSVADLWHPVKHPSLSFWHM
ncbi:hypothetical protein [Clavibacter sp. MX14-G9D]|uniref:hypothetical protein n=1 Tax=Clavibacter sp. MX14-G9D TaxID=3064656 RepID=UPI00293E7F23|nr:hypothetical protein [Clavibacter sp. MX14-G9D]